MFGKKTNASKVNEVELEHGGSDLAPSSTGTSLVDTSQQVVGSSKLYTHEGHVKYVPMPTPDPKDPLNLPTWRKVMALVSLSFFGALSIASETIVGAYIPVFALYYAGLNPKLLGLNLSAILGGNTDPTANPLKVLDSLPGPPLWRISLLASLPYLTNGIASFFLVPLSIAIGRRPVLLACGVLSFTGGFWAATTTHLDPHLAARCLQALGAGAVEALVPLTVQDLVFIHERNRWMSIVWAAQGLIVVSLGVASPAIVLDLSWRDMYWIASAISVFAWFMMIVFLPETRWHRSQKELAGEPLVPLQPGEYRPKLDNSLGPRTIWTDVGFFVNGYEPRAAWQSILDTVRSFFFPTIFWIIIINSAFTAIQNAASQTLATVLLSSGWNFRKMGLAVLPAVVASPFVWFFGGFLADKITNYIARRNGGKREPEAHLFNMIVPLISGIAGCVIYGYVGDHSKTTAAIVLLVGVFLIALGFLTANSVLSVFAVESYPQLAGPVLVNVTSFRCIIGFALSFRTVTWIEDIGFLGSFGVYAGVLGFATLFLPLIYIYGKPLRRLTAGTVQRRMVKDEHVEGEIEKKTFSSVLRSAKQHVPWSK